MNTGESFGKSICVTCLTSETETVTVRRLPNSKLADYIDLIGKDTRMIALLCDKPADWADQLSDDSIASLIEAGRELNEARAITWATRTLDQNARLQPIAARLDQLGMKRLFSPQN